MTLLRELSPASTIINNKGRFCPFNFFSMKIFWIVLLNLLAITAFSQSVVPLRGDTIKIYKQGGSAELVLQNKTKDTLGFLKNMGNGRTEFHTVPGGGGSGTPNSHTGPGYWIDNGSNNVLKTFSKGLYQNIDSATANTLKFGVDTASMFPVIRASIPGGTAPPFADNAALVKNNADNTKLLIFSAASITTATSRTLTAQDANGTIAILSNNLGQFGSTTSAQLAGTISDETGSGSLAFATSPLFVTPRLASTSTTGFIWTATDNVGNGSFQAAAAGFADPLTTNGDIIARITGSTTRLAQGSNGTFLGVSGGALGYYVPTSTTTRQSVTSGTSQTGSCTRCVLTYDFSAPIASYAYTFPASPSDLDFVRFELGGTVAGGNTLISSFTVIANSGQSIVADQTLFTGVSGAHYEWVYRTSNTSWYLHIYE